MTRRIDYYDNPAAPPVNSLVPSVNVIVANAADESWQRSAPSWRINGACVRA